MDIDMTLVGSGLPQGQIEAEALASICLAMQKLSTSVGRHLVGADGAGRTPGSLDESTRVTVVGLTEGSTVISCAIGDMKSLDRSIGRPTGFDDRLTGIVEAVLTNSQPDGLSRAERRAGHSLGRALIGAAREVTIQSFQRMLPTTETSTMDTALWREEEAQPEGIVRSVVGVLDKVDLKSRAFRIADDAGNTIHLRDVANAAAAASLIGARVTATGYPEIDDGRLSGVRGAIVSRYGPQRDLSAEEQPEAPRDDPPTNLDFSLDLDDAECDAFIAALSAG